MLAATSGWGFDVGQTIIIGVVLVGFFVVTRVWNHFKTKKWDEMNKN